MLYHMNLRKTALPHMRSLSERVRETVFLTTMDSEDAVCIETVDAYKSIRFFVQVGRPMPLHAAAAAKILLAFKPQTTVEVLLHKAGPFPRLTPHTITEVQVLLTELKEVVSTSFA